MKITTTHVVYNSTCSKVKINNNEDRATVTMCEADCCQSMMDMDKSQTLTHQIRNVHQYGNVVEYTDRHTLLHHRQDKLVLTKIHLSQLYTRSQHMYEYTGWSDDHHSIIYHSTQFTLQGRPVAKGGGGRSSRTTPPPGA